MSGLVARIEYDPWAEGFMARYGSNAARWFTECQRAADYVERFGPVYVVRSCRWIKPEFRESFNDGLQSVATCD